MNFIDSLEVVRFFNELNSSGLSYVLLRNIDNELPSNLQIGKDIDLLVRKNENDGFSNFLHSLHYISVDHPLKNDLYLYGVDCFEFKRNVKNHILLDLHYQIAVRSLDAGQWIPLDQMIQDSAWNNRHFHKSSEKFSYWTLSYEDEFITLLARSIFDKKTFKIGYLNRLNNLHSLIDFDKAVKKLERIFFKYTPALVANIKNYKFENLIDDYLRFKEY